MTEENDFYKIMWAQKAKGQIIEHNDPLVAVKNLSEHIGSYLTYIGETGIYTGTLIAEQINAVQGIVLGTNATVQWSSVLGAPTIPTLPSYITATKITQTTIESPTINAGTINGVTITGSTITAVNNLKITRTGLGNQSLTFGDGLNGYDSPHIDFNTSVPTSDASLDFYAGTFSFNPLIGGIILNGPVSTGNLDVYGRLNANGGMYANNLYGIASANIVYIGTGGSGFENTSDGIMRLKNGSGAYLKFQGNSFVLIRADGSSVPIAS